MNYLATLQRVKNLTALSNNVDSKMIDPYMRSAQVLKMQPNLGVRFQDEILAELATEVSIAAATATNPVVVTTDANHGFTTGDSVYIADATGMVGINGQWTITVTGLTTFELDGLDGTLFPAYNAGTATVLRMSAANVALMPYIEVAYAWWVLRDAMPFIWMHITNSTMLMQGVGHGRGIGGEGGTPASPSDMKWMVQNAQNLAEAYTNDMLKFLACNSSDYPTWAACCTNSDFIERDRTGTVHLRRDGFKKRMLGA